VIYPWSFPVFILKLQAGASSPNFQLTDMRTHPLHPNLVLVFACLLALLVFSLGITMPTGHFWGGFLLPILSVFLWGRRRDIYIITAIASVLVVITFWANGAAIFDGMVVTHLLSLAILWAAAWLLAQRRQLVDREQGLAAEVAARTAELQASEQRYRLLAENAGDLIWAVDMDGRIIYASPAAQRVRGVTGEEELAASWFDRMPPAVAAGAAAALEADLAALRAGKPIDRTPHAAPAYRKDGTLMWTETIMSPLYDKDGKPVGLCGTTRDITARHEAEEALRRSEERFATLFAATPTAIVLGRQSDLTLLDANDAFLRLTGFTRAELAGRTAVELGILSAEVHSAVVAAVQAKGRACDAEVQLRSKSGAPIEVVYSTEPIEIGGEGCFVSGVVDISARKRLEAELQASVERWNLAADISSLGFWDWRAGMDTVVWDERMCLLHGLAPGTTVTFAAWRALMHPDDRAAVLACTHKAVLEHMQLPVEYRVVLPDGALRYLLSIGGALYDAAGAPVRQLGITMDITERMRGEQALRESQARYQMLADHATDVIWSMDPAGTLTYLSPSVLRQRGFTPEEAMRQKLEETFAPASTAAARATIDEIYRLIQAGEPVPAMPSMFEMLRKDGTTYWGENIHSAVYNEQGVFKQLVGATRDVTKRVQAERKLSEAYDHVQLAVDAAGLGIWNWNCADDSLEWDDRVCALFGVPPAMRAGGHYHQFWRSRVHPDDAAAIDTALAAVRRAGTDWRSTFRLVLPGGEVRHIYAACIVKRDASGKPLRMIGINRDITDQVLYEQLLQDTNAVLERRAAERTAELQAAVADLQRAGKLKDEFMAMISHELRTPLTGVLTMSELLEDQVAGPLNARQATYVKSITQSGERLLNVINGILEYTHLLSRKAPLQAEPCELAYLLNVCAAAQQRKAAAKHQAIAVQVEPHDLAITADATAIADVIKRLLDNAVKFTPGGGQIGLAAHPGTTAGTVDLVVWDTGIGITPDQFEQVFRAFVQADGTLSRVHEGLGLGLAYVDQMVHLMGGTIALESTPGEGSRFTISLPA
jgi:PAS domain S-box-containing protein